MTNLYELTSTYAQLQAMIEDGVDESLLLDTIESVQESITHKVEGYTRIIRNLESDVLALREEEKRLAERRRGLERSVSRLKDNLFDGLKVADMKQVKGSIATVSIRKTPPSLKVENEDFVPSEFFEVIHKLKSSELKAAVKSGREIPGVSLVSGESLSIR